MNTPSSLGANHFTLTGENTRIVYDTHIPGPPRPGEGANGGQLHYQAVEGDLTFRGKDITQQQSPLGTLLTVVLKPNNDTGGLLFTLLLPQVSVSHGQEVPFQTLGIKTALRGLIAVDGSHATYAVFPLLGLAQNVVVPV